MQSIKPSRQPRITAISYIAAGLFCVRFIFFFLPFLPSIPRSVAGLVQDGTLPGALLANAEHLVLFPIVAALPAPRWARAAGYGWLVVDMATDIMALNGVSPLIYLALRYGGHISSAVWAGSASWQARGASRIVGLLYALDIALYSYIPHGSFLILLPSAILLPVWLILLAQFFKGEAPHQAVLSHANET